MKLSEIINRHRNNNFLEILEELGTKVEEGDLEPKYKNQTLTLDDGSKVFTLSKKDGVMYWSYNSDSSIQVPKEYQKAALEAFNYLRGESEYNILEDILKHVKANDLVAFKKRVGDEKAELFYEWEDDGRRYAAWIVFGPSFAYIVPDQFGEPEHDAACKVTLEPSDLFSEVIKETVELQKRNLDKLKSEVSGVFKSVDLHEETPESLKTKVLEAISDKDARKELETVFDALNKIFK